MLNYVTSTSPSELTKKDYQTTQKAGASYEYTPDWMFENKAMGDIGDNVQMNSTENSSASSGTSVNTVEKGTLVSGCSDGKNDGRIGIGSAICNTLWGAVKSVGNTVKDIVTDPKKALVAAATTAVCIAFPPAAVAVGVVGAVTGVVSGAKAVGRAIDLYQNADGTATDAEAKAAFQDLGASALQVGLSAVAVKGGLSAMKSTQGSAMAELAAKGKSTGLKGFGETVKAYAKDTVTGGRGFQEGTLKINTANAGYKGTQMWGTVKGHMSKGVENVKTNRIHINKTTVGDAANNVRPAASNGIKSAGETITNAGQNIKANGFHPIQGARNLVQSGTKGFSAAAAGAGYNSTFGALSAPVASQVKASNELHSNYDAALASKIQSTSYEGGNYDFSNAWSNIGFTGDYSYDTNYDELAQYAGYNARQIVGI